MSVLLCLGCADACADAVCQGLSAYMRDLCSTQGLRWANKLVEDSSSGSLSVLPADVLLHGEMSLCERPLGPFYPAKMQMQ